MTDESGSPRRADPRTGIVWTLDREDGSVVHLVTRSPSRHTTRSYATWMCWQPVTNPQVARVRTGGQP